MSNTNKIKITTLIDPNEFYFKFLDNARHDENCRKIRDIESKISRMRYDNSSVFNVGEVRKISIYFIKKKSLIRSIV